MAASHVRENALLVHRFKTRKLSRLLIRFVRCFIVTSYSSCAFFLLKRTIFRLFFFFLCPFLYARRDCPSQPSSFRHFRRPEAFRTSWSIIRLVPVFILRRKTRRSKNSRLSLSNPTVHFYYKKFLPLSLTFIILWLGLLLIANGCVVFVDRPSLPGIQDGAIRCDQLGVAQDVWSQWVTGNYNLAFLSSMTDGALHPISFWNGEMRFFPLIFQTRQRVVLVHSPFVICLNLARS